MTPNDREWIELGWTQFWQVTSLVLVVGLAARLGCRRRPHLAYILWLLVGLKCLAPPLWSSPAGLFSWARLRIDEPRTVVPLVGLAAPLRPEFMGTAPPLESAPSDATAPRFGLGDEPVPMKELPREAAISPGRILLAVWLAGATALAGFVLRGWGRFRRVLRASAAPAEPRIQAWSAELAQRLGLRRRVEIRVTPEPVGPAVFGLRRPTVVLPQALLDSRSLRELEPLVAHELIHVRRGDLWWGALQAGAQVVWWFHPLVWWANRETCRERERCCDEEVVAGLKCRPGEYARGLLDVLESQRTGRPVLAVPGLRSLEITTQRLGTS